MTMFQLFAELTTASVGTLRALNKAEWLKRENVQLEERCRTACVCNRDSERHRGFADILHSFSRSLHSESKLLVLLDHRERSIRPGLNVDANVLNLVVDSAGSENDGAGGGQ